MAKIYIGKLPITNTKTHFSNARNANKSSSKFPPCFKSEMMHFSSKPCLCSKKIMHQKWKFIDSFSLHRSSKRRIFGTTWNEKGLVRRNFITFLWRFEDNKTLETFNFGWFWNSIPLVAENASISLQLKPFATCLKLKTSTCEHELESFYSLWFWKLRWFGR